MIELLRTTGVQVVPTILGWLVDSSDTSGQVSVLVNSLDSLDTNIVHVILEIVVDINKPIARSEFKIVKKYIVGVIGIISASSAINTVVFCIDSEMV
jgi:hypothetical protein